MIDETPPSFANVGDAPVPAPVDLFDTAPDTQTLALDFDAPEPNDTSRYTIRKPLPTDALVEAALGKFIARLMLEKGTSYPAVNAASEARLHDQARKVVAEMRADATKEGGDDSNR